MIMKRIGILFALSCLMTGCGIYKNYSRPDMNIDSLYRNTSMIMVDTVNIASMSWRDLFTDLQLQMLITKGIERNTDLAIARLQVEETQATLTKARLSYLPSLNLMPQAGISRENGEIQKSYNLGATATWEVEVFGKITNAKRGVVAALEQRCAYEQAVQTRLIATIAESYHMLLMLDEQLAISEQTLINWNETITTLELLMESGEANDVAVRQAYAGRTALEASMETIRKNIRETENSLCTLLKEPSHTVGRSTLNEQYFSDTLSVGVPLQLLANRPDVKQAEAALAEAFYATNSARSAFYPNLTLSGTLGWTNNGGHISNPEKWLSNAVVQLVSPLFNKGTNIANLKIAKARQQEAVFTFEQSLFDAANEVNNALIEWQTADRRIRLDEQQIKDLEMATEKTRLLVRYTSANYLEVLTAQQALLTAQLACTKDKMDKIYGIIHLYHTLGGGKE